MASQQCFTESTAWGDSPMPGSEVELQQIIDEISSFSAPSVTFSHNTIRRGSTETKEDHIIFTVKNKHFADFIRTFYPTIKLFNNIYVGNADTDESDEIPFTVISPTCFTPPPKQQNQQQQPSPQPTQELEQESVQSVQSAKKFVSIEYDDSESQCDSDYVDSDWVEKSSRQQNQPSCRSCKKLIFGEVTYSKGNNLPYCETCTNEYKARTKISYKQPQQFIDQYHKTKYSSTSNEVYCRTDGCEWVGSAKMMTYSAKGFPYCPDCTSSFKSKFASRKF